MNPHARVEGLSPLARALRGVFRGWQHLRAGHPSPCRFTPTCSAYGIEAVEAHGAVQGAALVVRRVLRCHPWGRFGYDPVPEKAR
jgi:putative membrane protein insertion efficiency factor